jgi:GH15 family glucan-1,4-alpha-glucosidase
MARSLSLAKQLPQHYRKILSESIGILLTHTDKRGSVMASSDSDMLNYGRDYYHYCWPRDAVYVMYSLMLVGQLKPARNYFEFCRRTMNDKGYMMHKSQADGSLGSSWHPYIYNNQPELPIQEDETAGVIWLMGKYWDMTHDRTLLDEYYEPIVKLMANFMTEYIDESTGLPHASYDLWEQKFLTSTYTVSVVIAALEAASKLGVAMKDYDNAESWSKLSAKLKTLAPKAFWNEKTGFFHKGYYLDKSGKRNYDETLDSSSFYGMWRYKVLPIHDAKIQTAYSTLQDKLHNKEPAGGYLRFVDDDYLRAEPSSLGNPWNITTLWVADFAWRNGDEFLGRELLDWVVGQALNTGALSEQINPKTGEQISVSPLSWSHSAIVYSILNFHALGM